MAADMSSPPLQSNTRAWIIFIGYLSIIAALTLTLARSIYHAHVRLPKATAVQCRNGLLTFTILTLVSLAVTWYYMISFFVLDYQSWEQLQSATSLSRDSTLSSGSFGNAQLGAWLSDVKLFRDAWETVVETPARTCWSLPIFFITTAWSFLIAKEAQHRRIKHAWAYMVLGQLVAISFAMNLFYLAVLVHPLDGEQNTSPDVNTMKQSNDDGKQDYTEDLTATSQWTPPQNLLAAIRMLTFLSIAMVIVSAGSSYFLLYLALPHLLLLLPPVLHETLPKRFGTFWARKSAYNDFYKYEFRMVLLFGAAFEALVLARALTSPMYETRHVHRHSNVHSYPWQGGMAATAPETVVQNLWRSLFDHPAVSSVGFDSVLCVTSYVAWKLNST